VFLLLFVLFFDNQLRSDTVVNNSVTPPLIQNDFILPPLSPNGIVGPEEILVFLDIVDANLAEPVTFLHGMRDLYLVLGQKQVYEKTLLLTRSLKSLKLVYNGLSHALLPDFFTLAYALLKQAFYACPPGLEKLQLKIWCDKVEKKVEKLSNSKSVEEILAEVKVEKESTEIESNMNVESNVKNSSSKEENPKKRKKEAEIKPPKPPKPPKLPKEPKEPKEKVAKGKKAKQPKEETDEAQLLSADATNQMQDTSIDQSLVNQDLSNQVSETQASETQAAEPAKKKRKKKDPSQSSTEVAVVGKPSPFIISIEDAVPQGIDEGANVFATHGMASGDGGTQIQNLGRTISINSFGK